MSDAPGGSLAGEVAIVTGGSRGIGRAIVELFVQHGAAVLFCDRDLEAGRSAEENLAPGAPAACSPAPAQHPPSTGSPRARGVARAGTIEITADADGTVWVGGAATGCVRGTITL